MNKNFLLPNKFKLVGWVLLSIGLVTGFVCMIFEIDFDSYLKFNVFNFIGSDSPFISKSSFRFIENGLLDEIITILIIIGGILVGFCKTKMEDEYISQLRLSSLVWSVYVSFGFLFVGTIFVYGLAFFNFMLFNMFTVLLFFIIRFHIQLYKANRF